MGRPAWRLARGWTAAELLENLQDLDGLPVNFRTTQAEMTPDRGWNRYYSEAVIAAEAPGPPLSEGPFRRCEVAVANYQFSDPRIVIGHFDPENRLLGRRMLLEMKAVRLLHYLGGVVVGSVRFEEQDGKHVFGFRYDTLEGHIERGSEWFLLSKDAGTGVIRFRIEAAWLPGDFPNWWSRLGFKALGPRYQKRWHEQAHRRLYGIARGSELATPPVDEAGVAHAGLSVAFERNPKIQQGAEGPVWEKEEVTIRSS